MAPLIIGGGPAGSAAAIHLSLAGHRPLLLERAERPEDKVCGDFIGADAIGLLAGLGIDPSRLGAAPLRRLCLVHRGSAAETTLPFPALGLSRKALDAALLDRAAAAGARVTRGVAVRRLTRSDAGWTIHTATAHRTAAGAPARTNATPVAPGTTPVPERLDAAAVFLCTGKHDLRDHPRPGTRTGAVGMKTYLRLAPDQAAALAGTVELYLFPNGYAGLQSVEDGKAVLCAALRGGRIRPWDSMLADLTASTPRLRTRLRGAQALLPRPLAVAGVPYGLLPQDAGDDSLFRAGDQSAVIPSLAGDGIAIALHSGRLAAACWLDGAGAGHYHRQLRAGLASQMRIAVALHHLAMMGRLQGPILRAALLAPASLRWCAVGTRIRRQAAALAGTRTRGLHPA